MLCYKNITPTNGFDFNNLSNARQNNYAWCITELDDYIYVGTSRNLVYTAIKRIIGIDNPPSSISPIIDNPYGEIWRYKKDDSLPWKLVYKADINTVTTGFRAITTHAPLGADNYLYAAGLGKTVKVFKSSNGVDWYPLNDSILQGTSSRSLLSHKGNLYIATMNDVSKDSRPLLYSSIDPEFYPWELLINPSDPNFIESKNPQGSISNMSIFNDKLFVATSTKNGIQVWRSNDTIPKMNEWTLVVDNGFGDPSNNICLSMGSFKNNLYVSGTKSLPLSWAIPRGFDLIRIGTDDTVELIIGGKSCNATSLSTLGSGFNNPFNVYAWQIKEYNDKLFISTFDDSSNMKVILDLLLKNKSLFEQKLGTDNTNQLIEIYQQIVKALNKYGYSFGFDLFESQDGIDFNPVFFNGLKNRYNYGGRVLYVDKSNTLYLGTANPFEGCEVWACKENYSPHYISPKGRTFDNLGSIRNYLSKLFAQAYSIIKDIELPDYM